MINKNRPLTKMRFRETLFNSFNENPRILVLIICFGCLLLGGVLAGFVGVNTMQFGKFINDVTPTEIEKIEIQRTDKNGKAISSPITITDKALIASFATASKTVQKDSIGRRLPTENETKVKVWLKNSHTIEFDCYTAKGYGKTIFVGYVWLKPSIYSFGNGNVHFPEAEFYNWLLSTGK